MKKVFNLIVVDESGSMSVIKRQALAGMNETIETIKAMQKQHEEMEQRITLITFDSTHTNFIFNNAPADSAHPLKDKDYNPCGATPLYDAIGQGVTRLFALVGEEDHVLVTIITDGMENASQEYSLEMVKSLIKKLEKQNWTFSLIGTDNLDVEIMAYDMNIQNHLSFKEDAEGTEEMFMKERVCRMEYNRKVSACEALDEGGYFHPDK